MNPQGLLYLNGEIVRACDAFRERQTIRVHVAPGFGEAWLCDLTENKLAELPSDVEAATVTMKPFEIATLRFSRAGRPQHKGVYLWRKRN